MIRKARLFGSGLLGPLLFLCGAYGFIGCNAHDNDIDELLRGKLRQYGKWDLSSIEKLLKTGANPNARSKCNGNTSLHSLSCGIKKFALYYNSSIEMLPEVVALLLNNGAKVHKNNRGNTPLSDLRKAKKIATGRLADLTIRESDRLVLKNGVQSIDHALERIGGSKLCLIQ